MKRKPERENESFQPTRGVRTLTGNPRSAILRLSLPMILAMSVQTLYNFVDAIWVAGIGADALAAVGFFFPFHFMIMAIASGIGVGGGSAVSRYIGALDRGGAQKIAAHSHVLVLLIGTAVTVPTFFWAPQIFAVLGAGPVVPLATAYGRVMFAATLVVFFAHVSMALLRAEGDVKRAMTAMLLGAGLNIILDPLFIYGLRMGVAGAAWATVISMSLTALLLCRWICFHKDMWITVTLKKFRFQRNALKDIFTVGFPSAIQHMAMSLSMLILNMVAVIAGGTDGVAVFSTGWRVATFATLPLLGIATAVTSVTAAAYGGKDFSRLDNAFQYAVRLGFTIEIVVAAVTFLAADFIAGWFTFSASSVHLRPDLVQFLRTMCVFYPSTAFGMLSSAMFQGIGRGMNALAVTVVRTLVLAVPMAWLLAIHLELGLTGLWWGVVVGNITGAAIAWTWARHSIRTLSSTSPPG